MRRDGPTPQEVRWQNRGFWAHLIGTALWVAVMVAGLTAVGTVVGWLK